MNEKRTLSYLIYCLHLFDMELQNAYLHAAGEQFDRIRQIATTLREESYFQIQELSQMAIALGEPVHNLAKVFEYVDRSQWEPDDTELYDWNKFTDLLSEKGKLLLDAFDNLEELKSHDAEYVNSISRFWHKEIDYKNSSRQITAAEVPEVIVEDADDTVEDDPTSGLGDELNSQAEEDTEEYENKELQHFKTAELFSTGILL